GIYHDQILPYLYARDVAKLPPFFQTTSINNPLFPFPSTFLLPVGIASLSTVAWHVQTPTTYQYHFDIEQELFKGAVLDMSYIGVQGRHLWRRSERNTRVPIILQDGTKFFSPFGSFQNPSFGSIRLLTTDSNSNYNALRIAVRRASTSGLEFQAFYTFSK